MRRNFVIIVVIIFLAILCLSSKYYSAVPVPSLKTSPALSGNVWHNKDIPISDAQSRITKKPFGVFISPQSSPVSPEKFTGYHTGTDFEIFPGEENQDIKVYAFCDGELALKKYATGYGGVAIQRCTLNNQDVTIVYGHLKLISITSAQGVFMKRGDMLGILGKGYSPETDGERKHLHLGIHKGTDINILGYVSKHSELSSWMDSSRFLY